MVDPEVIVIPIVFGLPTIAFIIRSVLRHNERMAELNRSSAPSSHVLEERLARVEQALEAIAIEMERVGEGQRFLTKVFAEQRELPPGSNASSRPSTPH